MTATIDTTKRPPSHSRAPWHAPAPVYRIEGEFRDVVPQGTFAGSIRFLSRCEATILAVTSGITDPTAEHVSLDINGLVVAPDGVSMPLQAVASTPGFEFPDLDFRVTGSAYIRAAEAGRTQLDGSVVSIEGWVNFESGELEVEARPL